MLDTHINSLGKYLAINVFVYNDANRMLGDTVDSPMVTFVGHSFLNSNHSLDVYNVTLLVDSHVCGQRNNSRFSKRPREHVAGAPPLSLRVGHFGELLEDGSSGRKKRRQKSYHLLSFVISSSIFSAFKTLVSLKFHGLFSSCGHKELDVTE